MLDDENDVVKDAECSEPEFSEIPEEGLPITVVVRYETHL